MLYLGRISAGSKAREIARATGIGESTISRWKGGLQPTPHAAVTVARAFKRPGIEALVAAGHLDLTDLDATVTVNLPQQGLDQFTTVELAGEIARRAAAGGL